MSIKKRPKLDLEEVKDQIFKGINFSITDKRIDKCLFFNCNILYSGGSISLANSNFYECHFSIMGLAGKAMSGHDAEEIKEELIKLGNQFIKFTKKSNSFDPSIHKLYKYMKAEHASDLIKRGILRIGTLYEFQDIEKYGNVVGDSQEGIKGRDKIENSSNRPEDNKPISQFAEKFFKISPESKGTVLIKDCLLRETIRSPDFYLYCMTMVPDLDIMQEFGYDTCIEIININAFIDAISNELSGRAEFVCIQFCAYTDRFKKFGNEDNIHPALIKDPTYAQQREVRAIWRSNKTTLEPIILKIEGIGQYCRIVKLDTDKN